MPDLIQPGDAALELYMIGAMMGIFSVILTRTIYFIEDEFEKLPIIGCGGRRSEQSPLV